MTQMDRYERGKRDGVRFAITFIHEHAKTMNDPSARAALNCAAFYLGNEISPKVAALRCAPKSMGIGQSFRNEELGNPVRPYASTFSAVSVLKKMFNLK